MELKRRKVTAGSGVCHDCHLPYDGGKKYRLPCGAEVCEDCIENYVVPAD